MGAWGFFFLSVSIVGFFTNRECLPYRFVTIAYAMFECVQYQ